MEAEAQSVKKKAQNNKDTVDQFGLLCKIIILPSFSSTH